MTAICFIKVTEQTSPLIQELLFTYGFEWGFYGNKVSYTDYEYLYLHDNKRILYGSHDTGKCIQVNFSELLTFLSTGKLPEKQKIFSSNGFNVVISKEETKISRSTDYEKIPNSLILEIAEKIKCF